MIDKIYLDVNIILDLFLGREPFFNDANEEFTLLEKNRARGYASPLVFSNLFYILRKYETNTTAITLLSRLKMLIRVVTINERIVDMALSSGYRDFEDAVHYYSALESGMHYLLTRNKKDYVESDIVICSAGEYLALRALKKRERRHL